MATQLKNRTVAPDGKAIQRLRIEKGWRVEDLAKQAECSLKTVENVERGENVYLYTLSKFAQALGIEVSTLIAGAIPPEPPKRGRVLKVIFEVSTPFEEFDESKDLVTLLQALIRLVGGDGMEPTGVEPGSTLIVIEMTFDQFLLLSKAYVDGRLDDLNIEIRPLLLPDDLKEDIAESLRNDESGRVRGIKLQDSRDRGKWAASAGKRTREKRIKGILGLDLD